MNALSREVETGPARTRSGFLFLGLVLAVSMTTIDQTIVSLAAPTVQTSLGLTSADVEWMVNAYLLAAAAAFPIAGRLADVFGYRRVMLVGIVVFAAASAACGLTPEGSGSAAWMIMARVAQGVGAALMFPAAVGMLVDTSAPEHRTMARARFFALTGAMTAVGPVLGGYLVAWSWRSVFFLNLPIAVAAFLILLASAPRTQESRGRGVDPLGGLLVAATMVAVVLPLQHGGQWGWTSAWTIGCLLLAVLLLLLFIRHESACEIPVMRLQVFRSRRFTIVTLASLLASISFVPIMYFLSVYGQLSLALTLGGTSMLILKFFIGFLIASQIGARRFDRVGARSVVAIGGAVSAVGFLLLSRTAMTMVSSVGAHTADVQALGLVLAGGGIGFMFSPAATDMVNRAISATYGEVTALTQTMKNLGGALGMALFASIASSGFTKELGEGLSPFGVSQTDVASIASVVTSGAHTGSSMPSGLDAAHQQQILQIVRASYASGVSRVFLGMALVGVLLALVGLMYPREKDMPASSVTATSGDAR